MTNTPPPDYVLRKGRRVLLPAEAEVRFDTDCAACGAVHPAPVRLFPKLRGAAAPVATWRALDLPLCLPCATRQERRRRATPALLALALVAVILAGLSTAPRLARTWGVWAFAPMWGGVALIFAGSRFLRTPVRITLLSRREELAFEFPTEERARAFAAANEAPAPPAPGSGVRLA